MAEPATTSWKDWADWALKLYQARQNSKPGEFQKAPEDPGQTALRAQLMGYMQNSPTRNMLGDILQPRMRAAAENPYKLPQGVNGYNPYPNGGPAPKYDLEAIFKNMNSSANPNAPAPPISLQTPVTTPLPVGGGGGGGDVGGDTPEHPGGKRLPTVMRDSGGGFNSSTVKGFDDPSYQDVNMRNFGGSITGFENGAPVVGGNRQDFAGFTQFLQGQGFKDAAKIALGFFSGGLTGAALASAKVAYDRYQASKGGKP